MEIFTSKDSLQESQKKSGAENVLDKDMPSEEYSYEWSSEVFDPEMSESEDITALPLAVFVQPSEKKLEVTDLEAMSEEEEVMSEEVMSEEPFSKEHLSNENSNKISGTVSMLEIFKILI